ncbi:MAG: ABC transporter permease [Polyangiaceae bacterium]
MSPLVTIARREFRSYWDSPLAYVVICLGFLALGVVFFTNVMDQSFWQVDRATLQSMFEFTPLGLIFLVPVITMRLMAEERRSGTLEMLITLPVKDSDVVMGKYLGALGLVLVLVVATLIYPIAMFKWPWDLGSIDMNPVWSAYLGLILYSAATVSIGLLVSSLTESQAVAFFLTLAVLLALWILGVGAEHTQGTLSDVLAYASTRSRLEGFVKGLIDTRDIVFFVSITVLCLVFSFRALERRKWA